jgi:NADH-quinone oxidoreductase subunit E
MKQETTNDQNVEEIVRSIVLKHGATNEKLIPILLELNQVLGYLPSAALEEVSIQLKVPKSQLFSVASFYHMFSTKSRGRHVVQFCDSAPCHVVGGAKVWQSLREELNLDAGETSLDGKWSLTTTSCLGICGVGPIIMIDDDIFGNVQPDEIAKILANYK